MSEGLGIWGGTAIYDAPAPLALRFPCRRCWASYGYQTCEEAIFHLTTAEVRELVHLYTCQRCGLTEELTHEFAHTRQI